MGDVISATELPYATFPIKTQQLSQALLAIPLEEVGGLIQQPEPTS